MKNLFKKAFILPLIVVIAVALVGYKISSKPPIEHAELQLPTKTVEIITAQDIPFSHRAIAYGNIEPAKTLKAKTEINGKIIYIHPNLKKGASLAKDTVVLRIEPTAFEFSLEQSKAGLASSEYSLQQLEVEEKTTLRFLATSKKNFSIGQKEFDSAVKLLAQKVISSAKFDATEQKLLQLQQQVEDLQGKLASFPSRKAMTVAQINKSKTQLAQSEDILKRTEIILPFDARIGSVFVEKGEYIGVSGLLFEALGTEAVEINAQLPIDEFSTLLSGHNGQNQGLNLQNPLEIQAEFEHIDLDVTIQLVQDDNQSAVWQGELVRISESVNPKTNTIGLVVRVDNPYGNVVPGKQPPLLKGMFVRVEFVAPAQKMLVLPRKAIHQGRVYIANSADELEIRAVEIIHKQAEMVIVENGIQQGDKIIITDIVPVIEGLPLKTILAIEFQTQLQQQALGKDNSGDVK